MAKVIWTEPARDDLTRIYDFIAKESQSFDVADRICNEILEASFDRPAAMPESGALVLEAREHRAREICKHSFGLSTCIEAMRVMWSGAFIPAAIWPDCLIRSIGRSSGNPTATTRFETGTFSLA